MTADFANGKIFCQGQKRRKSHWRYSNQEEKEIKIDWIFFAVRFALKYLRDVLVAGSLWLRFCSYWNLTMA